MLYSYFESPIGKIELVSDEENILGLHIEGQKNFKFNGIVNSENNVLRQAKLWLEKYFNGKNPDPKELNLKPIGGEFRQLVWNMLCDIPYGTTITYGEIANKVAKQLGKKKMSAQAIGSAVGHNPISIIIPCHRVVGQNNKLTGYEGGLDLKKQLLLIEGVDISKFSD